MNHDDELHIGISGIIAAGKTTLTKSLGKEMNLPIYLEDVTGNKYLEDFYKNQKKYGFPLQIYLLNKRFKQQQKIIWSGKGGIQDRTIYEDKVFCRLLYKTGKMKKRDFDTYCSLFDNMSNFMRRPNLIIHLQITPEESLKRLKMRNRGCETKITLKYLQQLYDEYEIFITEISKKIPVIRVDYRTFQDPKDIVKMILEQWENMCTIKDITYS